MREMILGAGCKVGGAGGVHEEGGQQQRQGKQAHIKGLGARGGGQALRVQVQHAHVLLAALQAPAAAQLAGSLLDEDIAAPPKVDATVYMPVRFR